MLAGFSMLADMLTKQTAAPKVADNGPTLFCGMSIGHEFLRVSKNEKC